MREEWALFVAAFCGAVGGACFSFGVGIVFGVAGMVLGLLIISGRSK